MARRTHKITRQDIERAVRMLSRPGTPEEVEALVADLEGKHYGARYPYEVESFIVGQLNDLRGHGGWVGTGFSEQGLGAAQAKRVRVGDVYWFLMTNLPGKPWLDYHVLAVDVDGDVTFSSIPPERMQHQAEHFRMGPAELEETLAEGLAKRA